MGLIDEISIQRIHIEEKIRGHDISHLVVLIVLMTVDASCRLFLLFLSGSLQESMLWRTLRQFVVYRFRYFLVHILYLWKLGHVVIDFPYVVTSWFRQNFDQIESILYLFLHFFKYMFLIFKALISIVFYKMSRSVVAEMSSCQWSIYCCNFSSSLWVWPRFIIYSL